MVETRIANGMRRNEKGGSLRGYERPREKERNREEKQEGECEVQEEKRESGRGSDREVDLWFGEDVLTGLPRVP